MNRQYTVVFTQNLPLGGGVATVHCSWEVAPSPREAADQCIRSIGGYGKVVIVLAGHAPFEVKGEKVTCWDNRERHDTQELSIEPYTSKHETRAMQSLPKKRKRRGRRGRNTNSSSLLESRSKS